MSSLLSFFPSGGFAPSSISFISIIRDYIDLFSSHSWSTWDLCTNTIVFFFQSFVSLLQYVLTFGWIRDSIFLPLSLPSLQDNVLSGNFFGDSVSFVTKPAESDSFWSMMLIGFANSFFCCLPVSTSHLLSIRRLFVQGVVAGVASTIGNVLGECLFLGSFFFGFHGLIPFVSFHSVCYFVGIYVLFHILYEMATEKRVRPMTLDEPAMLKKFVVLSFFLSWSEQSSFFHFLSHLNVTSVSSVLETPTLGFPYFLGLILGHIFFHAIFLIGTLSLKKAFFSISKLPYSVWLRKMNFAFLTLTLGLSLTSIPFYSFDYFFGSPLGFTSQDQAFSKSIFVQNELEDGNRLLTSLDSAYPFTISTDISHFDRGNYVSEQPGFFQKSFEELNYQSEYAWTNRRDKKPNLYSSAQTTKTTILEFFQGKRDVSDDSSLLEEPLTIPVKLPDSFKKSMGKDRQKMKKRFETNYGDMRESENLKLGESFLTFPLSKNDVYNIQEKAVRKKYFSNPIYHFLLYFDIDRYLQRSAEEPFLNEAELFSKMRFLREYYDTMRSYQQIPYKEEFQEFFQGSKSYVDRAYHHQFKGNLKVVSRYFDLSLTQDALLRNDLKTDDSIGKSVLSFDQPLDLESPFEEHEELEMAPLGSPFFELSESMPFYLGYDEDLSSPVLTTRSSRGESAIWKGWPLSRTRLLEMEKKGSSGVVTLFHSSLNPDMKTILTTLAMTKDTDHINVDVSHVDMSNQPFLGTTVPAHLKFFGKSASEPLIPNAGGFVWSGHFQTSLTGEKVDYSS